MGEPLRQVEPVGGDDMARLRHRMKRAGGELRLDTGEAEDDAWHEPLLDRRDNKDTSLDGIEQFHWYEIGEDAAKRSR